MKWGYSPTPLTENVNSFVMFTKRRLHIFQLELLNRLKYELCPHEGLYSHWTQFFM